MSLRSLGYFITRRRFYPRKIYSVQVESSPGIVSKAASVSAAGRPGRSLHTLRHLGAGANAYYGAALVAAALAGGIGILMFKKHRPDDDAGSNVTNEDTNKELSLKPMQQVEVTDIEKRDDVDTEAMFRDWMKRVGKVYPNQKEERKRFEVFKDTVKETAPRYEKLSVPYIPKTPWADMTYEELNEMRGCHKRVNVDRHLEEEEALTRMIKEREQKMKEEGNLHNCSKQ